MSTIPESMQAVVCEEFAPIASLQLKTVPTPTAKAHEVLVKISSTGVNFPDGLVVQGLYQVKPPLPFIPGSEVSGEIVAVGDKVTHLNVGQQVIAWCMLGGFAEYVSIPATHVFPLPAPTDMDAIAGLITAHATAHHGLKQRAEVKPEDVVLVTGAAGGTGSAAVQIAKVMGATVIAACSSAEKCEFAKSQGADHTIDLSQTELKAPVMSLTEGRGVDVVYECVGGALFDQCVRTMAFGGRLLVVGFASGEIPQFSVNLALVKGFSVVGVFWGTFTQHQPEVFRDNMAELIQWYMQQRVHVHVDNTFSLSETVDALEYVAGRKVLGKVIVKA